MSTVDVVARLQLRAEQFSSETGARFAEMKTRAASAAQEVRQSFSASFAEVQKLAERSLQMPRTATGALDLSSEIASLRSSAVTAEQTANAHRELSAAMLVASNSGRAVTESMRTEADAAMVAARASEADATAIRQRIIALEEVQRELNKTATATVAHTAAANDNVVRTGQQRAGMQQLSFQLNDVATQYASGAKASMIFAQQSGQVIQAIQLMSGEAKGFLGVLAGPWGIALTSALVVLAPFVGKLLEHNDALKDATDKLRKDATETELNRRAKENFSRSLEGVVAALRDQDVALRKSAEAERTSAEQANIAAKNKRDQTLTIRQNTLAWLENAQARLAALSTPGASDARLAPARDAAKADVTRLEAQAKAARKAVQDAERELNVTRVDLSAEQAQTALDPVKAVTKAYDDRIKALKDEQREQARLGRQVGAASKQRLQDLEAEKKAEVDKAQARVAASKRTSSRDPETATASAIAKMLRDTLPGVQVTATTNGKHVANSYHYKGQAVDFVPKGGMDSMSKDDVRKLFTSRGINVVELLGPGDRGHSNHFHVAWTAGKNALLEFSDAAKRAKEAQRELEQSLDSVLTAFDPAAAAAKKYAEELASIDELVAKKAMTRERGEELKLSARLQPFTAGINQQASATTSAMFDRAEGDLDLLLQRGRDAQRDIVDSWLSAADGFRYAAGSLADLFDIRIQGPARMLLQKGGIEGQSQDIAKVITDCFGRGIDINPEALKQLTDDLASVIGNASYGQIGGSVFQSITGGKQSKAGGALGGIIGGELGKTASAGISKALGGALGPTLGKALGSAAGPLGALVGGAVVGGVLGALFKKKSPSGSVDITGTDASAKSASGKLGEALTGNANAVQKSLTQIAEQLGAVTGAFSVSIGKSGDWYHVAGTAGADVSAAHPKSPLLYEGQDEGLAVQAAILNALQDGAIKGISEASQRILKSGKDLDLALQKALLIEAVPRDLKSMVDPIGAAIDDLNRKFQKTVDALKEGGASAEQMAQAQRLYDLQLGQVKNSTSSASQSLKDFMASLKLGSSSPYSLRDQEATARAALTPYLDQIASGASIDQAKYQSAANTFLDIERQLYGSTQAYFDALDTVQAATSKAISSIDNATPISAAVPDPFTKATADAAAKTAAGVQTGNEMAEDTNNLLARLVEQNAQLLSSFGYGGYGGDFIGADRLYLKAG